MPGRCGLFFSKNLTISAAVDGELGATNTLLPTSLLADMLAFACRRTPQVVGRRGLAAAAGKSAAAPAAGGKAPAPAAPATPSAKAAPVAAKKGTFTAPIVT